MIHRLFSFLKSLVTVEKDYKMQTFTFFIPSPPARSTGYREKQLDKLFYEFINRGYKIINFTTQLSTAGEKHSGMWIICLVQATNAEAEKLNVDEIFTAQLNRKKESHADIEGLYYIDDQADEL